MKDTALISIGDFSHHRSTKKHEEEFANYLDILSFGELINEASALKEELVSKPFDQELTSRSQIIFSQFIKRLQLESPDLAATLRRAQWASQEQPISAL